MRRQVANFQICAKEDTIDDPINFDDDAEAEVEEIKPKHKSQPIGKRATKKTVVPPKQQENLGQPDVEGDMFWFPLKLTLYPLYA